ncbi:hypothetical protein D9M71_615130 [compost metagenome]
MGRRVLAQVDFVHGAGQDLAIAHQQRAEGAAALLDVLPGQFHGLFEENAVFGHGVLL